MHIKPALRAVKIKDISVGELFLFQWNSGKCFAIKVSADESHSRSAVLTLGPDFPGENKVPMIMEDRHINKLVIGFGTDYTLSTSVSPDDWSIDYSFNRGCGVVIDGAKVLFCALGTDNQIFVDLENSVISQESPADRVAFTKAWKIEIGEGEDKRVVVQGEST